MNRGSVWGKEIQPGRLDLLEMSPKTAVAIKKVRHVYIITLYFRCSMENVNFHDWDQFCKDVYIPACISSVVMPGV